MESPTGERFAVEVKTGMAERTAQQLERDALMATEGAQLVGKNVPVVIQGGGPIILQTIVVTPR